MKLQVTQENLSKAVSAVSRVANTRNTLPILSNIVLKTVGNRLAISATNLEIAITQYIGSKVGEPGSITVPARLTQDFVNSLPPSVIDLELDEYKLHLTTDQYKSVINGVSAEEYPVMPTIENGNSWTVSAEVFKKGLQQVLGAASNDEARPVLTGVYLHNVDKQLYLVATDSYRLAEKKMPKVATNATLLIPATALQDLLRLINDTVEVIDVLSDEQQVLFKAGDAELVTRLIEGSYPDYQKLVPQSFANVAKIKRSELTNITKVSSLFARESAGSVTIQLDQKAQTVSIRAVASQLGENVATASANITGEGEITLNSRYILDALNVLSEDEVELCFNGKLEACVLRGANSSDYTHVIMPLKS